MRGSLSISAHGRKLNYNIPESLSRSDLAIEIFAINGKPLFSLLLIDLMSKQVRDSLSISAHGRKLNYNIPESLSRSDLAIEIFTINGKCLFSLLLIEVRSGVYELDLSRASAFLTGGLYLSKMTCGDRSVKSSILLSQVSSEDCGILN